MNPNRFACLFAFFPRWIAIAFLFAACSVGAMAQNAGSTPPAVSALQSTGNSAQAKAEEVCEPAKLGSPFVPVDSWVYPAVWRLYALGYVDSVFLGMRPWTRASIAHMLEETAVHIQDADIDDPAAEQAQGIYEALSHELGLDLQGPCRRYQGNSQIESVYTIARGISGTPLDDSYHIGSTIINDYGRPFANGFNNYSGISGYATAGRFALYLRTEFQGAPSAAGYSPALYQQMAELDGTLNPLTGAAYPGQITIPEGPIASATYGRFLEAYVSFQYLNHVLSFGKEDEWLGPAQGASFAYSNNAQNIYAFHINRIEPLRVPLLSRLTGPFRYEFLIGQLRGHTLMPNPPGYAGPPLHINVIAPGDPMVHVEKISFKPTMNVEFGFERTVIWAGEGHSPATIKNFLRSFFSTYSPSAAVKDGPDDPGARFGSFDFTYRLPFVRKWLTLYTDGEVHDDVSPIDAPRRAAWRPGLYLSHVPGVAKLDVRAEAATTDPPSNGRTPGQLFYFEGVEKQGYTNQGQIFGDWIGRQDKGGQAWLTYHLSGNEWVQLGYRNQKAEHDFIPGGTTLNDVSVQVVKRIGRDFEINGNFAVEHWTAPVYLPGEQTVTATTIHLTWYPERKVSF
jgi:hypothetical protein